MQKHIVTPRERRIWAALAGEGVPMLAIARAFKVDSDIVAEILTDAVDRNHITALPPMDWAEDVPKAKQGESVVHWRAPIEDETERMLGIGRLVREYKITTVQAEVALILAMHRETLSRDMIAGMMKSGNKDSYPPGSKSVDQTIHRLRSSMLRRMIVIETIYGAGWLMTDPSARRILNVAKRPDDAQ